MSMISEIWLNHILKQHPVDKALMITLQEYGTKEIVGPDHNPEVLKYFKEAGFPQIIDDETSWCSAFINWTQMKAGRKGTGSLAARSWMNWGESVFEPRLGDIAVFWRTTPNSWQGHVGYYISNDGTGVWVLGGNQSNMVNIARYPGTQLLGYRRFKP